VFCSTRDSEIRTGAPHKPHSIAAGGAIILIDAGMGGTLGLRQATEKSKGVAVTIQNEQEVTEKTEKASKTEDACQHPPLPLLPPVQVRS
jgi:hypothetical protein